MAGVAGHREWFALQSRHHQEPTHPLGQLLSRWRDQPERQAAVSAAEAGAVCAAARTVSHLGTQPHQPILDPPLPI